MGLLSAAVAPVSLPVRARSSAAACAACASRSPFLNHIVSRNLPLLSADSFCLPDCAPATCGDAIMGAATTGAATTGGCGVGASDATAGAACVAGAATTAG